MLNSQTLDIVVGLALTFLTLSVVVSAINEFFAQVMKTRFNGLQAALQSLLGSDLAQQIIDNPTVPAAPNGGKKQPSYIEPAFFTAALLDKLAPDSQDMAAIATALQKWKGGESSHAAEALESLAKHANGSYNAFVGHVSAWFDAYMDRVSGDYKRQMGKLALIVSFVVVVILNVDTVKAYRQLSLQPAFATALAGNAQTIVATAQTQVGSTPTDIGASVNDITKAVGQIPIPVGWTREELKLFWPPNFLQVPIWIKLLGLVISGIAGSLGAPFWFDVLGKLANLRSSGTKPDPVSPPAPAPAPPPPPPQPAPAGG
jgi:hypothetical protein